MSAPNVVTGSCLCQTFRYKVTGPPKTTVICHCDSCRKGTGSAFMANSLYLKDQLQVLTGEDSLRVYVDNSTGSGKPLSKSFCSICGSSLFVSSESIDPSTVAITSGTMDLGPSKGEWEPKMEFFCARRREWLAPVEGTAKHDTMM
ncbi:putative glutathione-dependent formaldehyde-activating enzyme [Aspergillus udagawae]|uniref:Glutathione-dependent formaldehyde-activating enzyme n=1 Tax=Aspergillus udagawae TaxID=91492 RepID=A0ABQ1BGR5_9EURO|nr:putative glutathione-dependent formaldehyde-activating enzyme [Aspergillus udagawae]